MSDLLVDPTAVFPFSDEKANPDETTSEQERGLTIAHAIYIAASVASTIGWCWLLVRLAIWVA